MSICKYCHIRKQGLGYVFKYYKIFFGYFEKKKLGMSETCRFFKGYLCKLHIHKFKTNTGMFINPNFITFLGYFNSYSRKEMPRTLISYVCHISCCHCLPRLSSGIVFHHLAGRGSISGCLVGPSLVASRLQWEWSSGLQLEC